MEDADIGVVRAVMGSYSLHDLLIGPIFSALQEAEILTLIKVGWGGSDPFVFLTNYSPVIPVCRYCLPITCGRNNGMCIV